MAKSGIRSTAVERVTKKHRNGVKAEASYYFRRAEVGYRTWYENGRLWEEFPMRHGERHGIVRGWHPNGRLSWQSRYVAGKQYGATKYWDPRGKLLSGRRHITIGRLPGFVQECNFVRGVQHGRERFWQGKHLTLEGRFAHGKPHGIWKSWNLDGRLKRSFPHYYIYGKKVTKVQYLKACKTDKTLPIPEQHNKR